LKWDRTAGQYLLLYPERGLALNDSAAAILKLCDGSRSVDEIVAELTSERGRSNQAGHAIAVHRDVAEFLDEMLRRGLVEPE
jgi:coenzyme PQQ biosynthesis protein PqqD